MKIINQKSFKNNELMVPVVSTFETKSPPMLISTCSWSDETNISELLSILVNKIELEFSNDRTRISNSQDPLLRRDSGLFLLISGVEAFLGSYRPASEDDLVEFAVVMRLGSRIFWASLGHFSLYGVIEKKTYPIFCSQDYSYSKLRIPRRGLGLSDKREFIYGDFGFWDFERIILSHGFNCADVDLISCLDQKGQEQIFDGPLWICDISLE